ncbi:uncharacterized protein LOC105209898 [Zeugodacus cucurbitae]|uniref:uncharacterized protein LOC105209898 n=1 Tax=Zeugodacus cucurbitae TaxID=28588 RepID=UPI0023D9346E|nr:uncharacterized protein LOC105209898 [Zeugodacus cucurbitae]
MHTMDSTPLRTLLNSWGLAELFPQLQDENIGIDELKMMKCHHVGELLHSYKLGTRIRFEYYFERWRRDQNQPLLDAITTNHYQHYNLHPTLTRPMHLAHTPPPTTTPTTALTAHKSLQTRATNTPAVRCVNVATNTSDMLYKMPPPQNKTPPPLAPVKDALREMPQLTRQPSALEDAAMLEHATHAMSTDNTNTATTIVTPAPTTTTTSASTRLAPQFQFINDADEEEIDNSPLLHILNSSGFKGTSLLEYYQQHQHFTNVHRTLLIQLIVNFFDMNEYHLSLKVSHNLEQQILKLFPSEKLEYYRTEKRGKIYVKFCNMKRYKRDKPLLKRKWLDESDAGEEGAGGDGGAVPGGVSVIGNRSMEPVVGIECGGEDVEDLAQSFEYWHAQHSPAGVQVKTESLSDGDY